MELQESGQKSDVRAELHRLVDEIAKGQPLTKGTYFEFRGGLTLIRTVLRGKEALGSLVDNRDGLRITQVPPQPGTFKVERVAVDQ